MGSETEDTMLTNVSNTGVVASTPAAHNKSTNNGDHHCWRTATGTGAQTGTAPTRQANTCDKVSAVCALKGERPSTQHGGVSFCWAHHSACPPAACLAVESICCASPHGLPPLSPTHGPGSTVVWHQLTVGPTPTCVMVALGHHKDRAPTHRTRAAVEWAHTEEASTHLSHCNRQQSPVSTIWGTRSVHPPLSVGGLAQDLRLPTRVPRHRLNSRLTAILLVTATFLLSSPPNGRPRLPNAW